MQDIEKIVETNVAIWQTDVFDKKTRQAVISMKIENTELLKDSFYKNLEFGTGGMRGVMGIGPNRINKYTIGKNTQGLSNYLKKIYPKDNLKVVIAYDCRNQSNTLAKIVADVFSANKIKVFLFSDLRTTPQLSFSVRELHSHCGIVITASHNPPEYNGYKVYWKDGGQIVPPQDTQIISEIEKINFKDILFKANTDLIELIDKKLDDSFIHTSLKNGNLNAPKKNDLSIVFTPLHGTSITAIPETLKRAGYDNVHIVEEQKNPDGNFPTVASPNPEEPEALKLALEKAESINADIVIGTDPDSDRLGIAVRDLKDQMVLLNGNQIMVLMTQFLLEQKKETKGLQPNDFIATTIVSTPMMKAMAEVYGLDCKISLTGFKWIAKMIEDFPHQNFICGGEESFGFMVGDFVRDKDAVTASLLACEIAAIAKANHNSFYKELLNSYVKFGFYKEHLISLTKKGIRGTKEIQRILANLRQNPPKKICDVKVMIIEDYAKSIAKNNIKKTENILELPKSNVLIYYTEDGSKVAVRPSGTEPKIKFYISVTTKLKNIEDYASTNQLMVAKINTIVKEIEHSWC